jgi:hypothetical protein
VASEGSHLVRVVAQEVGSPLYDAAMANEASSFFGREIGCVGEAEGLDGVGSGCGTGAWAWAWAWADASGP